MYALQNIQNFGINLENEPMLKVAFCCFVCFLFVVHFGRRLNVYLGTSQGIAVPLN